MHIILLRPEWAWATCIGCMRNEEALARGFRAQYGLDGDDPRHHEYHIYGCCSELACAIAFDLIWPGTWKYRRGAPDLWIGNLEIDVKHTVGDDGRLCIPTEGHPDWYYVLVTGIPPVQDIRGWMLGSEAYANKKKYFRKLSPDPKRSPQYYVDQCDLHPVEELLGLIKAEKLAGQAALEQAGSLEVST